MDGRIVLLLCLSLFSSGCKERGPTSTAIRLRLAATVPESDAQADVLKSFKTIVEDNSNGQIRVQLFFSGVLGNDTEILQKTQMNILQGCNISTSNAAIAVKEFKVFDLPYIFRDQNDNLKLFCDDTGRIGGPITERLQSACAARDLSIGLVLPILFRAAVMRSKLVLRPEDFQGIKMRTSASPIERAIVSAMGANPVTMGVSEVYTGLQQGTVDGEGFPPVSIVAFRHHEAAKKISTVNFQGFAGIVLLNHQFYESLPIHLQDVLADSARQVMHQARTLFQERYREAVSTLRGSGCDFVELNEAQRAPFKEKTLSVILASQEEVGRTWIETVQRAIQ